MDYLDLGQISPQSSITYRALSNSSGLLEPDLNLYNKFFMPLHIESKITQTNVNETKQSEI